MFLFDVVRVVLVGFVCECAKSCELEENSETLLCKDRMFPLPIMKLPAEYMTDWAKICRIDKFCHIRILAYNLYFSGRLTVMEQLSSQVFVGCNIMPDMIQLCIN